MTEKDIYDAGYHKGYHAAVKELTQMRIKAAKERKTAILFFAQKLLGILILVATVIFIGLTGEVTVGLFSVPLGFYILLTGKNYLAEILR